MVIIKGRNAKKDMETKGKNELDLLLSGEMQRKRLRQLKKEMLLVIKGRNAKKEIETTEKGNVIGYY